MKLLVEGGDSFWYWGSGIVAVRIENNWIPKDTLRTRLHHSLYQQWERKAKARSHINARGLSKMKRKRTIQYQVVRPVNFKN